MPPFKSGFVAIAGRPNVGKSTLLNCLLGRKLAPVSRKPQTTRQRIHGILTRPEGQIIFIDTPGLHEPRDPLGRQMVSSARKSFEEGDLVYFMVEPEPPDSLTKESLHHLANYKRPVFLVINKVDLLQDKRELLPAMESYHALYPFKEIIPVSALNRTNIDDLLGTTFRTLPEGEKYFPEEMMATEPIREIVKELIREKVIRFTGEEIPYVTAVGVEEMRTRGDGLEEVHAMIYVDKESQKGILIGKGGEKIKQIGQEARREIEELLGHKVFLGLRVKVLKGWKKDPSHLRTLGY